MVDKNNNCRQKQQLTANLPVQIALQSPDNGRQKQQLIDKNKRTAKSSSSDSATDTQSPDNGRQKQQLTADLQVALQSPDNGRQKQQLTANLQVQIALQTPDNGRQKQQLTANLQVQIALHELPIMVDKTTTDSQSPKFR
ncbi:uncharacterized protein LOC117326698 [Pecten maximus]|uniref:uncharacterized protein LOC117326698 n=1 Tax=Pecten maximus TaxID=6579 RepID=UPI0014589B05|nr:uncharacterized protein LOC117326698 [Pecten maximus]